MQVYKRPKHTRTKIVSSIRNFFWSLICLVGAIVILVLAAMWLKPLFTNLANTVTK
jgi:hypothetical protein